jgi:hypothetical protein
VKNEVRKALREEEKARLDPEETRCAREYALALADPFSLQSLPCDPTADAGMSLRWKVHTRGIFNVGSSTDGVGYIVVNPYWGFSGSEPIAATDATYSYATTGIHTNQLGVNGLSWPSPIKFEYCGGVKLVGFGLKVQFIGKPLECSGTITKLRSPDNFPRGITLDAANIFGDPRNSTESVRVGKTYYATWAPYSSSDHTYATSLPPTRTSNPDWRLGFYVQGAQVKMPFSYELVGYYEAQSSTEYAGMQIPSNLYKDTGARVSSAAIENDQRSNTMEYGGIVSNMVHELKNAFWSHSPAMADAVSGYVRNVIRPSRVTELPTLM